MSLKRKMARKALEDWSEKTTPEQFVKEHEGIIFVEKEPTRCLRCQIGCYVHDEWQEEIGRGRTVTIVSEICESCGHNYYSEMARLAEECYQASEKEV